MPTHDLVVRNAYEYGRDAVVDVAVDGSTIAAVEPELPGRGETEIDADGNLISPGFVDAHVHLDQALTATGERFPKHNDDPFEKDRCIGLSADYFASATVEEIEANALAAAELAVASGTLHVRTHAYVDEATGTKSIEALLSARDRLEGLLDLQIVAFPQRGFVGDPASFEHAREGLRMGADLVGGIDPASVNGDVERSIDAWFDLATEFDVDVDAHLHDPGSLGMYTLDRLAAKTVEHGYEGRVTASHCFALADAARAGENARFAAGDLDRAIERFARARLQFVTCYPSTHPGMPICRFQEEGLAMAHGTDEVRDLWVAHGNADSLQGALIESLKLDTSYSYARNAGLDSLWRLITTEGASVLGLDDYGIEVGHPADFLVHESRSPQWAILTQSSLSHVVKGGRVVARHGSIVDEHRVTD